MTTKVPDMLLPGDVLTANKVVEGVRSIDRFSSRVIFKDGTDMVAQKRHGFEVIGNLNTRRELYDLEGV